MIKDRSRGFLFGVYCFVSFLSLNVTLKGYAFSQDLSGRELIRVDDIAITEREFEAATDALGREGQMIQSTPEIKQKFLEHMVNSRLVARLARKEGFEKDPRYQARLRDMTEQLLAGEYMDRLLDGKITESSLRVYFENNREEFAQNEVKVKQIVLATEEEAKLVLLELKKDKTKFDEIAKQKSKDKTVDLGYIKRGQFPKNIESMAFTTKKGELGKAPAHSPFGWHVLQIMDRRGDGRVSFLEVKDTVKKHYRAELQEEFLNGLRKK